MSNLGIAIIVSITAILSMIFGFTLGRIYQFRKTKRETQEIINAWQGYEWGSDSDEHMSSLLKKQAD